MNPRGWGPTGQCRRRLGICPTVGQGKRRCRATIPVSIADAVVKRESKPAAARGAINGLMAEVLEEHIREHLAPADSAAEPVQADAAEELIEIIHSYLT